MQITQRTADAIAVLSVGIYTFAQYWYSNNLIAFWVSGLCVGMVVVYIGTYWRME